MGVDIDWEAEVCRQVAADLTPRLAGVVGTQDVPVLLHEQNVRARRVHRNAMNAVSDFRVRVGQLVWGFQPAIHRLPCFGAVIGAEGACRRDGDKDSLGTFGMDYDRVQAHAPSAGLPEMTLGGAQSRKLLPGTAAVHRLDQRRVLRARVHGVRIGQRGLEMPDALELPRVLRSVVPLVRAGNTVVFELIADGFPGFSAVLRTLDHLSKPPAGLRGVQPIRVRGRAFHVVNFPPREVWSADFPPLALAIRGQDKCTFLCTNQYSYSVHIVFVQSCDGRAAVVRTFVCIFIVWPKVERGRQSSQT